jgi:hypothetical protein
MPDDKLSPADIAFKAMQDARAKLKAAGVNYYVVVAWDGFIAEDGNVDSDNGPSVIQRLQSFGQKLQREQRPIASAAE